MSTDNPNLKALLKEVIRSLREEPTKWSKSGFELSHCDGRVRVTMSYMRNYTCYIEIIEGSETLYYTPEGWFEQFRLKLAFSLASKFHKGLEDAEYEAKRKARLCRADQTAKVLLKEGL